MKKALAILFTAFLFVADALAGPTITNVLITGMTSTTATIQWTTNTPSSSQLLYGTDLSLPYSNVANPALQTSHSMTLTLLNAGPMYYVSAVSKDNTGITQSPAITFSLCGSPTVTVQGTVNNYYEYGTYTLTWVPPSGASQSPTVCGQSFSQTVSGSLDGGGSFNDQVSDASKIIPGPGQWAVTIADAGHIAPITVDAYLSQLTQNVSQQLQLAASTSGLTACIANTVSNTHYPSNCGGGSGAGVASLNGLSGGITLAGGTNVTLSTSGNTITINASGTGAGVTSFNTLTGPVTISPGNNVSFNTSGNNIAISSSSAIGSVGLTVPSWLSVANSPLTGSGTLAVTPASAQTSHQVIGTCGTATTFTPCALQAADIPSLSYISGITGDVVASGSGSVAGTVKGINGVLLSSLATGLLMNTTATGIPSIANSISISGYGYFGTHLGSGSYQVPCSATPVFDLSQGNFQQLTLCANVTSSSVSNLPMTNESRYVTISVCQPSSGGPYSFSDPTWVSGWNSPTQSAGGCTDTIYAATSAGLVADGYNAEFCAVSGASPLACDHAAKGYGTIATGTNPTATVNTTAVGPSPIILVYFAPWIGTIVNPAVTCNTTYTPIYPSSPIASTSFGVNAVGTVATNPLCFEYVVVNQ